MAMVRLSAGDFAKAKLIHDMNKWQTVSSGVTSFGVGSSNDSMIWYGEYTVFAI
jgi:hypothetical protein